MVDYFSNPPKGIDLSESRTSSNNAIGIVLFILATIAIILRVIARTRFQNVSLAADDYFMFGGLFMVAGNLACCIAGGFYGLGKHIWIVGPYNMEMISIITFAYVYIYAWSVTLIKYSIILFYRRIFTMTRLAWWCVFLSTGYLIANHIVLPLYCAPISYYWTQWSDPGSGRCLVNEAEFYLVIGIINLFGDVFILLVPVQALSKLQMPIGQKIAVYLIFLLGSFVCIASIIRICVIKALTETADISWAKSDVFIWSSVEPSVAIISGCLPTMRPILIWVLTNFGYTKVESSLGSSSVPTISKIRTRPLRKAYALEDTQFEGDDVLESRCGNQVFSSSGNLRPNDDEVQLTTIFASRQNHSGSLHTTDTAEPIKPNATTQAGW